MSDDENVSNFKRERPPTKRTLLHEVYEGLEASGRYVRREDGNLEYVAGERIEPTNRHLSDVTQEASPDAPPPPEPADN